MLNIPHRHLRDSMELEKTFAENYWQVQEQDIVCIPSLSFSAEDVCKITGNIHYEERQLFNILLLKHPSTRLIYVTSAPLDPFIVKYYTSLLPSHVSRDDLDKRLILLSTNDASPRGLAEKVLQRPKLIARIKSLIRPQRGFLLCFTSTEFECRLAKELEIPVSFVKMRWEEKKIFGNDTATLSHWGSKSGGRDVFDEAGIPHARGVELSHTADELAERIAAFVNNTSGVKRMIVKLNYGFSGQGNAMLDLSDAVQSGSKITKEHALEALKNMKFSYSEDNWELYRKRISLIKS